MAIINILKDQDFMDTCIAFLKDKYDDIESRHGLIHIDSKRAVIADLLNEESPMSAFPNHRRVIEFYSSKNDEVIGTLINIMTTNSSTPPELLEFILNNKIFYNFYNKMPALRNKIDFYVHRFGLAYVEVHAFIYGYKEKDLDFIINYIKLINR